MMQCRTSESEDVERRALSSSRARTFVAFDMSLAQDVVSAREHASTMDNRVSSLVFLLPSMKVVQTCVTELCCA